MLFQSLNLSIKKNFFKNVVIDGIKDGNIAGDDKKKLLISSIPFYRNLCEYSGKDDEYAKLTCFLHLKTTPIDTQSVSIEELWNIINPFLDGVSFLELMRIIIRQLLGLQTPVWLIILTRCFWIIKLVTAIAIRLLAEKFMQSIITSNGQTCVDASSNQTREWYKQAEPFLTPEQKAIIEEVNLITPESIHLNSFMFEPLIDISDWALKELFTKVTRL